MTKENVTDMLNGHRLINDTCEGEVYWNGAVFCWEIGGEIYSPGYELSKWKQYGWHRKPKPKMRPMIRNEVLSLFVKTPGIVVRYLEDPWDLPPKVTILYPYSIDKCEWGIMEMGEVVKGPFKLEVEE